MSGKSSDLMSEFRWQPQPAAAQAVEELLAEFLDACGWLREFAVRLHTDTGTRLIDFIDHFSVNVRSNLVPRLPELGFEAQADAGGTTWRHPQGLFPEIHTRADGPLRLALMVESVVEFLAVHRWDDRTAILGATGDQMRSARVSEAGGKEVWAVERHGWRGCHPPARSQEEIGRAQVHFERFRLRRRTFDDPRAGFAHAEQLVTAAAADLGTDWACDLFFAAERAYWQQRNRAGRVQKARQDQLGLGWANHDHHTYRSSREHFAALIAVLERLGFQCRERFYGGRDAGWGAQVLEQPQAGIVIFADVDLSPEEVSGDFAHQGLTPRAELGTVGLWCQLHGEAFLEAGMHHLECRFDFDAARRQLAELGVASMRPFTDLPYLKQAFTEAEWWQVDPGRVDALLAGGRITVEQAQTFRTRGALGSHLEILERDQGYKGFNQSGISQVIAETDPRRGGVNLVSPGQG
jgi:hypothetical protein